MSDKESFIGLQVKIALVIPLEHANIEEILERFSDYGVAKIIWSEIVDMYPEQTGEYEKTLLAAPMAPERTGGVIK